MEEFHIEIFASGLDYFIFHWTCSSFSQQSWMIIGWLNVLLIWSLDSFLGLYSFSREWYLLCIAVVSQIGEENFIIDYTTRRNEFCDIGG